MIYVLSGLEFEKKKDVSELAWRWHSLWCRETICSWFYYISDFILRTSSMTCVTSVNDQVP